MLDSGLGMQRYVVRLSEGVERREEDGKLFRISMIRPENVGSKKLKMGVLMLNPRESYGGPLHRHPYEEAYYVLCGKGRQRMEDEEFEVEKNTAIYIPADMVHSTKNTGDEPLWILFVVPI